MALPDNQSGNFGGSSSAPNRAPAAKVIKSAIANTRVANQVISAISGWATPAMIVATNVSQTIDFAALAAGDIVIHVPATAGNSSFLTVAAAGTLGVAAVVGDLYMVHRKVNLDSDLGAAAPLI